jgi:hypothetical protein
MADRRAGSELIQKLVRENARLRGESLVTGIILTQLLQSIVRAQLNPHAFATRLVKQAQDAVEEFKLDGPGDQKFKNIVKAAALETVEHYDTQIRSALPI